MRASTMAWLMAASLIAAMLCPAGAKTLFYATNPNIVFNNGRVQPDVPKGTVAFDWNGVQMSFMVSGTSEVAVVMEEKNTWPPGHSNSYLVSLDGDVVFSLDTTKGKHRYVLFSALSESSSHVISIFKATEPDYNARTPSPSYVNVHGVELSDGGQLLPYQAPMYSHRMLIIGDSISAGYGVLGSDPCIANITNENNYVTWNRDLCRAFDAECQVLAWSGMGLVQNYADYGVHMPAIFPRTLASVNTSVFEDWAMWVPEAVIINLGTNDYCCNHAPQDSVFAAAYVSFIQYIAAAYNSPSLPFFLVVGPMSNLYEDAVHLAIEAALADDLNVYFVSNVGLLANSTMIGCNSHPSVLGQLAMSQAIAPVIELTLNWTVNSY